MSKGTGAICSQTKTFNPGSSPGFTLIEIVIVLVILGLCCTLFLTRMDFFTQEQIRQGLRRLQAITAQVKSEALLKGEKRCLVIDFGQTGDVRTRFAIGPCTKGLKTFHALLPPGLSLLRVKTGQGMWQDSGRIKIRFLANGLSESATFLLSSGNRIYKIALQPFDPKLEFQGPEGQERNSDDNWF